MSTVAWSLTALVSFSFAAFRVSKTPYRRSTRTTVNNTIQDKYIFQIKQLTMTSSDSCIRDARSSFVLGLNVRKGLTRVSHAVLADSDRFQQPLQT